MIDGQTAPWGVTVSVVEVKDVEIPEDMPDSRVPEAAFALTSNLDYSEVARHSDRNLDRWNREVVG